MKHDGELGSVLLSAFALTLALTAGAQSRRATTHDGLQLGKSKKLDLLYVQPGATLGGYSKVWIDPVQVDFSQDWKPDPHKVNSEDRERIRTELARSFSAYSSRSWRRRAATRS